MIRFSAKYAFHLMGSQKRMLIASAVIMGLLALLGGSTALAIIQLNNSIAAPKTIAPFVSMKQWLNLFGPLLLRGNTLLLILGGTYIAAIGFLTLISVQLILLQRQDEVDIMLLAGATDACIKTPFYIYSLVQGILGGITGGCLWVGGIRLLGYLYANQGPPFVLPLSSLPVAVISMILVTGLGGLAGGHLALRKRLNAP